MNPDALLDPAARTDALARSRPSPALRTLRGVSKVFANGVVALDRVDLTIARGEYLSLLGPSGCGKSTLLSILAGLTPASAGTIERPASAMPDKAAFVFQEPNLMPWLTVEKNVALPLTLGRRPARDGLDEKVARCLALVGLQDFASVYPRQLSGGMKMRVSIARALVTQPSLLLLDEPFAAIDEITRARLNDDLLAIWQSIGCTIVMVTHSTSESVFLSSRIAVMAARPGRIIADVPIDEPYPRSRDFRFEPTFAARAREVSRHLDRA